MQLVEQYDVHPSLSISATSWCDFIKSNTMNELLGRLTDSLCHRETAREVDREGAAQRHSTSD